jgi:hypothetical protein
MRPHGVIVLTPTLDDNFCFGARAEPFEAEAFVAELAVEALGDAILPGLAGLDQRGAKCPWKRTPDRCRCAGEAARRAR